MAVTADPAVLQALLSYDARLDVATIAGEVQWVQVGAGFTPLHVAAVKGDYDIVKLLLAGHVQGLAAGAEVMQATHGQWGARHTGEKGVGAWWGLVGPRGCDGAVMTLVEWEHASSITRVAVLMFLPCAAVVPSYVSLPLLTHACSADPCMQD
jgi:hypothetical protein